MISYPMRKVIEETLITKGSHVLDLGAGKGEEIIDCVKNNIFVDAFEPHPLIFKILQKKFNNIPTVTLHNQAAWTENGTGRLYAKNSRKEKNGGATLIRYKNNVSKKRSITVETIDLAEYILKLDYLIDVLKIDIEGAEYIILRHLYEKNVLSKIKHIYLEDHSRKIANKNWIQNKNEVLKFYEHANMSLRLW